MTTIFEGLSVVTVLWSEVTDPFAGAREKNTVSEIAERLALFQHVIKMNYTGIVSWKIALEMLKKVVVMEGADHTGTGFTIKPPFLQVIAVGV